MIYIIEQTVKNNINQIPTDNVTQEDFEKAYSRTMETINNEFKIKNKNFIEIINSSIVEKENKVNALIDELNNNINSDKFKELNLQEIPRVSKNSSNQNINNINSRNNHKLNISEQNHEDSYSINDYSNYKNNDIEDYTKNITAGAAAGATLGTTIPVLGTTIGGLVGAGLGLLKSFIGSDNKEAKYQEAMEEMIEEHNAMMKKMQKESYKKDIIYAKKDATYEWTSNSKDEATRFISKMKLDEDNKYKQLLSQITMTVYNARDILKDMLSIIENPNEQKNIIDKNKVTIKELEEFIININKCFEV